MNFKKLVPIIEATVLSSVAAFLAAVSQIPGASFDGKHLAAAGVGAVTALAYKLSGVLSVASGGVVPVVPSPSLPAPTPQTPLPPPPAAG